ncbi:MAG TPA: hypothetical protein VI752_02100 [Candidatus Paceibacterota bacterium]
MKFNNNNSGFVILYAVIVASVVSLSGILLANIIVKQIILSSIGRESQFAYYAANVADECIKNAVKNNQFGYYIEDEFGEYVFIDGPESPYFLCEATIDNISDLSYPDAGKKIKIDLEIENNRCIKSEVVLKPPRLVNNVPVDSGNFNIAKGYNICDENHPRRIEKVIYRDYSVPSF